MVDKNDRNWLIRTRSMQILGPVSLDKVKELMEKNSLRAEDELTSGNGYWFALREVELVEKYIHSNVKQSFNPITEAPTLLAKTDSLPTKPEKPVEKKADRREEEDIAPLSDEDLEYPDMADMGVSLNELPDDPVAPIDYAEHEEDEHEDEADDMTLVLGNNVLDDLKSQAVPEAPKIEEKASIPEPVENKPTKRVEATPSKQQGEQPVLKESKAKSNPTIKAKSKKQKTHTKTVSKNDRYLFILLALFVMLIIGVVYYYKTILNRPLPGFETSWLMDSAHAQNAILTSASKKKAL